MLVAFRASPLKVSGLCNFYPSGFSTRRSANPFVSVSLSGWITARVSLHVWTEGMRRLASSRGKVINHLAMAPFVSQKRTSLFWLCISFFSAVYCCCARTRLTPTRATIMSYISEGRNNGEEMMFSDTMGSIFFFYLSPLCSAICYRGWNSVLELQKVDPN